MADARNAPASSTQQELVITRVFDAPRELVWKAWTEPEHFMRWWGPKGFTTPHCEIDFRVGGTYHYAMTIEGGMALWGKWVFREITPPERLVLIQYFSDPQGGVTRNPWSPVWPLQTLSTTTLTEQGDKTLLSLEWSAFEATAEEAAAFDAAHASMTQGWSGNIDVLEDYLSLLQTA